MSLTDDAVAYAERKAYLAEVIRDPHAAMLHHLAADYWARGYEQALLEHGLGEELAKETHGHRLRRADEAIAGEKAEAARILAQAELLDTPRWRP